MYWWLKDVLVERNVNEEQQQQFNHVEAKSLSIKKVLVELKAKLLSQIREQQQMQKVKLSYRVLNQLSDHYLTDIGLRRIDLSSIEKGIYPGRYQQSTLPKSHPKLLKLVSSARTKSVSRLNCKQDNQPLNKAA